MFNYINLSNLLENKNRRHSKFEEIIKFPVCRVILLSGR